MPPGNLDEEQAAAPGRRSALATLGSGAAGLLVGAGLGASACATEDRDLGPPDSYRLLRAKGGGAAGPSGAPVVSSRPQGDARLAPLVRSLEEGVPSELLRSLYLCKQYVREAREPFSREAVGHAGRPTLVLLEQSPAVAVGRGLSFGRLLGAPSTRPELAWMGLPPGIEADPAVDQTVAGQVAEHLIRFVDSAGSFAGERPRPLLTSYRMAMEVIAREWKTGRGARGMKGTGAGSSEQRSLLREVRDNRFVTGSPGAPPPPGRALLAEPRVGATVLYRMAQSKDIAHRIAPDGFYAPFTRDRVPPGITPAAVLGPFRNLQVKLLGVWLAAARRGRPPGDLVDLVELYGEAFPAERRPVLWTFLVTTYGATVVPGGVATAPAEAQQTIGALERLTEDILAGKRTLRDALAADAGAPAAATPSPGDPPRRARPSSPNPGETK